MNKLIECLSIFCYDLFVYLNFIKIFFVYIMDWEWGVVEDSGFI